MLMYAESPYADTLITPKFLHFDVLYQSSSNVKPDAHVCDGHAASIFKPYNNREMKTTEI